MVTQLDWARSVPSTFSPLSPRFADVVKMEAAKWSEQDIPNCKNVGLLGSKGTHSGCKGALFSVQVQEKVMSFSFWHHGRLRQTAEETLEFTLS